jgi:hypothetical protein
MGIGYWAGESTTLQGVAAPWTWETLIAPPLTVPWV